MYMFRAGSGLMKGGVLLATVLGIVTGYYSWKPVFDPVERDKWFPPLDTAGLCR